MNRWDTSVYCDGCGVELTVAPHIVDHHRYCCLDCAEGRSCDCGARLEMDDEHRTNRQTVEASVTEI